jgi:hypothetical protein
VPAATRRDITRAIGIAGFALAAPASTFLARPGPLVAQGADCPGNLLANPGFEAGFGARGRLVEVVGLGWTAWYETVPGVDGINYAPDYQPRWAVEDGAGVVHAGAWSQEMRTEDATHTAGLWQRVPVPAGSELQASIWSVAQPTGGTGGYAVQLGLDPGGGERPDSARVVWTAPITLTGAWLPLSVRATAAAPQVTLFARGLALDRRGQNAARWDDACLAVVAAEAATPPPTRGPAESATPLPDEFVAFLATSTVEALAASLGADLATREPAATPLDGDLGADAPSAPRLGFPESPATAAAPRPAGPAEADGPSVRDRLADSVGVVFLALALFAAAVGIGLRRGGAL